MTMLRSAFLQTITERGFMHQCTDLEGLDAALCGERPVVAYIGFDCTADSLHVGSLLPIMLLRHLQQCGHKPIVLLGGGTTKVGDPSGKDDARKLLSDDDIARNMAGIKAVFAKFLRFGNGPGDALMINNDDWLAGLNYIDFLRDYGRHFSVNRMLSYDSVKLRLEREQPLSFLEFNYMILQAYDFLELARRTDCALQMGGSDQWGNIVNGVELGRRVDGRTLFGLTTPLLATTSGAKMGKTAQGAVWLNADRLSAWDYWQFWRNTEDGDVDRFLRLFTDLPVAVIAGLTTGTSGTINDAKKVLANEATRLAHGAAAADVAAETARRTFEEGGTAASLPTLVLPRGELSAGIAAYALFVRTGLADSNSEARRLIKGGGARINDAVIVDETRRLDLADLRDGVLKLTAGKKRHLLVKVE